MKAKKLTKYQLELLGHLKAARALPDGVLDFDELLDRLSWAPTKEAAQFSIRALARRGLVAKAAALMLRRGRRRVVFRITDEGLHLLDPRDVPPQNESGPLADLELPAPGVVLEVEEAEPLLLVEEG